VNNPSTDQNSNTQSNVHGGVIHLSGDVSLCLNSHVCYSLYHLPSLSMEFLWEFIQVGCETTDTLRGVCREKKIMHQWISTPTTKHIKRPPPSAITPLRASVLSRSAGSDSHTRQLRSAAIIITPMLVGNERECVWERERHAAAGDGYLQQMTDCVNKQTLKRIQLKLECSNVSSFFSLK
jgi:hypothetical protein